MNFPERAAALKPADARTLRAEATRLHKAHTTSRFIGVLLRGSGRWSVSIGAAGQRHSGGTFDDEEQAAIERDKLAIRLLGGEARLNFHPETGKPVHGLRLRELDLPRTDRRLRSRPR